jgi:hypothetical protein
MKMGCENRLNQQTQPRGQTCKVLEGVDVGTEVLKY